MEYVILDNTDSTNSYAAQHADTLPDMTMIMAHNQAAGRGQRGNSWESEPGKNLTVTLIHKPAPKPELPMDVQQYRMSEAVALAVVDTLAEYGIEGKVKWPNDVYVENKKICGILIEHALYGRDIANSRIGIGLNVNQREFLSDAPNPVSMAGALMSDTDLELPAVLDMLSSKLELRLKDGTDHHEEYCTKIWRKDGKLHYFSRPETPDSIMSASIDDVRPEGIIVLKDNRGDTHEFRFKEVRHVLDIEFGEITIV